MIINDELIAYFNTHLKAIPYISSKSYYIFYFPRVNNKNGNAEINKNKETRFQMAH